QLGWHPRWGLTETLGRIVKWHKAWIRGEDMLICSKREISDYMSATTR
ncbi:CDP-glucose 4,6-dehydratase, partial [Salmonella enterica subsp. enterica serovar Enteritidis]|nr:CDP-glucose 4,6-dehydratase [Salmonella enterica subsp. enterica serovar Enteritidis]